jgi:deazaflavin-dependent oxidoreductase (nitroreductase family)
MPDQKPPAKLPPRWLLKFISKSHVFLNNLTAGRMFNTLGGDEVCFVTMRGAKSGRQITMPLMYVPYNNGVLLVASQGGAPKNPVWYNNIAQHPDIELRHRGRRMATRRKTSSLAHLRRGLRPLRRLPRPHHARHSDFCLRDRVAPTKKALLFL